MLYPLFISHSWSTDNDFEKLIHLLHQDESFSYSFYAVNWNDKLYQNGTSFHVYQALKYQLLPSSLMIYQTGRYDIFEKWIHEEVSMAQEMNKPILALSQQETVLTSEEKIFCNHLIYWDSSLITPEEGNKIHQKISQLLK